MRELQSANDFIRICQHAENRGLGASVRTGISNSSGDAILTLDADLTFHPRDFSQVFAAFTNDVDCVMGSPFLGKMKGVSAFRRLLSWGVNFIYRVLLGKPFTAVSSIFRLYRASAIKALHLTCDSFDINAEILLKLLASNARVVEVPVTLERRMYGVSKINTVREIKNHLKMFMRILLWKTKNQK